MIEGVIQQARHLLSSSSAHTNTRSVHYHSQRFTMTRMVKPLTETELHPELNLNGGGGERVKRRRTMRRVYQTRRCLLDFHCWLSAWGSYEWMSRSHTSMSRWGLVCPNPPTHPFKKINSRTMKSSLLTCKGPVCRISVWVYFSCLVVRAIGLRKTPDRWRMWQTKPTIKDTR